MYEHATEESKVYRCWLDIFVHRDFQELYNGWYRSMRYAPTRKHHHGFIFFY